MTTVRLGAWAWASALQFYVAQVVVASAWTTPFSLQERFISDLGNTVCGPYPVSSTVIVCSPWHAVMNASFVLVGITMAVGAILARSVFVRGWRRHVAVVLFVAAGIGVVMVGVYPENEDIANHAIGAGINFIGGNTALILFGLAVPSRWSRPWFVRFSVVAGVVGLVSTALFASGYDLGLGTGGIERFAAYTTTLWQIGAGVVLLREANVRAD